MKRIEKMWWRKGKGREKEKEKKLNRKGMELKELKNVEEEEKHLSKEKWGIVSQIEKKGRGGGKKGKRRKRKGKGKKEWKKKRIPIERKMRDSFAKWKRFINEILYDWCKCSVP
jgi:hypothetical protein